MRVCMQSLLAAWRVRPMGLPTVVADYKRYAAAARSRGHLQRTHKPGDVAHSGTWNVLAPEHRYTGRTCLGRSI